jgi:alpha 1,2-mannosyltransferase
LFNIFGQYEYNGLHFWSNFEIGDLNWFRSQEYNDYFEFLDKRGGFFYERWGDAPVHSLAVGMFLKVEEIHYFGDIGYRHDDLKTCPLLGKTPRIDLECDDRCDLGYRRYDWVYRGIWGPTALHGFSQIQELRNNQT